MKKLPGILAVLCSVLLMNLMPSIAKAACNPFTMMVSGPSVVDVDPTLPLGTSLWSASVNVAAATTDSCIGGPAVLTYAGMGTVNPTYNTYESGVAGVGIRMKYLSGSLSNGTWFPWSTPLTNWTIATVQAHTLYVEFVKTGPITVAGSAAGVFAQWLASGSSNYNGVWGQYQWAAPVYFNVAVPTCKVTTPSISVSMGTIGLNSFTGVGSTSGNQPLTILLQCSGGVANSYTNVYTTLTDAANPANVSDTLSLGSGSTATGVGIQILNGSTPVRYGPDSSAAGNTNQWFAGAAANGTFNIPLSVRYIQTAQYVTSGSANGRATFTMSYQ